MDACVVTSDDVEVSSFDHKTVKAAIDASSAAAAITAWDDSSLTEIEHVIRAKNDLGCDSGCDRENPGAYTVMDVVDLRLPTIDPNKLENQQDQAKTSLSFSSTNIELQETKLNVKKLEESGVHLDPSATAPTASCYNSQDASLSLYADCGKKEEVDSTVHINVLDSSEIIDVCSADTGVSLLYTADGSATVHDPGPTISEISEDSYGITIKTSDIHGFVKEHAGAICTDAEIIEAESKVVPFVSKESLVVERKQFMTDANETALEVCDSIPDGTNSNMELRNIETVQENNMKLSEPDYSEELYEKDPEVTVTEIPQCSEHVDVYRDNDESIYQEQSIDKKVSDLKKEEKVIDLVEKSKNSMPETDTLSEEPATDEKRFLLQTHSKPTPIQLQEDFADSLLSDVKDRESAICDSYAEQMQKSVNEEQLIEQVVNVNLGDSNPESHEDDRKLSELDTTLEQGSEELSLSEYVMKQVLLDTDACDRKENVFESDVRPNDLKLDLSDVNMLENEAAKDHNLLEVESCALINESKMQGELENDVKSEILQADQKDLEICMELKESKAKNEEIEPQYDRGVIIDQSEQLVIHEPSECDEQPTEETDTFYEALDSSEAVDGDLPIAEDRKEYIQDDNALLSNATIEATAEVESNSPEGHHLLDDNVADLQSDDQDGHEENDEGWSTQSEASETEEQELEEECLSEGEDKEVEECDSESDEVEHETVDVAGEQRRKGELAPERRKADVANEQQKKEDMAIEQQEKADVAIELQKADVAIEQQKKAVVAVERQKAGPGAAGEWIEEEENNADQEEQSSKEKNCTPVVLEPDKDRSNPAYIPRQGQYFEHDVRGAPEAEHRTKDSAQYGGKRIWTEDTGKWRHDKFEDNEMAPKARNELISDYGYDPRNRSSRGLSSRGGGGYENHGSRGSYRSGSGDQRGRGQQFGDFLHRDTFQSHDGHHGDPSFRDQGYKNSGRSEENEAQSGRGQGSAGTRKSDDRRMYSGREPGSLHRSQEIETQSGRNHGSFGSRRLEDREAHSGKESVSTQGQRFEEDSAQPSNNQRSFHSATSQETRDRRERDQEPNRQPAMHSDPRPASNKEFTQRSDDHRGSYAGPSRDQGAFQTLHVHNRDRYPRSNKGNSQRSINGDKSSAHPTVDTADCQSHQPNLGLKSFPRPVKIQSSSQQTDVGHVSYPRPVVKKKIIDERNDSGSTQMREHKQVTGEQYARESHGARNDNRQQTGTKEQEVKQRASVSDKTDPDMPHVGEHSRYGKAVFGKGHNRDTALRINSDGKDTREGGDSSGGVSSERVVASPRSGAEPWQSRRQQMMSAGGDTSRLAGPSFERRDRLEEDARHANSGNKVYRSDGRGDEKEKGRGDYYNQNNKMIDRGRDGSRITVTIENSNMSRSVHVASKNNRQEKHTAHPYPRDLDEEEEADSFRSLNEIRGKDVYHRTEIPVVTMVEDRLRDKRMQGDTVVIDGVAPTGMRGKRLSSASVTVDSSETTLPDIVPPAASPDTNAQSVRETQARIVPPHLSDRNTSVKHKSMPAREPAHKIQPSDLQQNSNISDKRNSTGARQIASEHNMPEDSRLQIADTYNLRQGVQQSSQAPGMGAEFASTRQQYEACQPESAKMDQDVLNDDPTVAGKGPPKRYSLQSRGKFPETTEDPSMKVEVGLETRTSCSSFEDYSMPQQPYSEQMISQRTLQNSGYYDPANGQHATQTSFQSAPPSFQYNVPPNMSYGMSPSQAPQFYQQQSGVASAPSNQYPVFHTQQNPSNMQQQASFYQTQDGAVDRIYQDAMYHGQPSGGSSLSDCATNQPLYYQQAQPPQQQQFYRQQQDFNTGVSSGSVQQPVRVTDSYGQSMRTTDGHGQQQSMQAHHQLPNPPPGIMPPQSQQQLHQYRATAPPQIPQYTPQMSGRPPGIQQPPHIISNAGNNAAIMNAILQQNPQLINYMTQPPPSSGLQAQQYQMIQQLSQGMRSGAVSNSSAPATARSVHVSDGGTAPNYYSTPEAGLARPQDTPNQSQGRSAQGPMQLGPPPGLSMSAGTPQTGQMPLHSVPPPRRLKAAIPIVNPQESGSSSTTSEIYNQPYQSYGQAPDHSQQLQYQLQQQLIAAGFTYGDVNNTQQGGGGGYHIPNVIDNRKM